MNLSEIIDKFIIRQKSRKVPDEEISEVIFLAFSVCLMRTMREYKKFSPEEYKNLKFNEEDIKNTSELDDYKPMLEKLKNIKINSQGENLKDVFERNMVEFLEEVEKSQ